MYYNIFLYYDKNLLKNAYTKSNAKNFKEQKLKRNLSVIRENIVNLVPQIWWNDIKDESIKNSFRKAGINLKQDASEDESLDFPKTIIDNCSIYDEFENSLKK